MNWREWLTTPIRYRWTTVYVTAIVCLVVCLCVAGGAR